MRLPSFITFRLLELVSFTASGVYAVLLVLAFALGNPEPATFIFGMTHGILWICMSLTCIAAARARVIPFWLAVTVAVLGGLGPFMGSIGFVVEDRRRAGKARDAARSGAQEGVQSAQDLPLELGRDSASEQSRPTRPLREN
jgi:hypothetical protein